MAGALLGAVIETGQRRRLGHQAGRLRADHLRRRDRDGGESKELAGHQNAPMPGIANLCLGSGFDANSSSHLGQREVRSAGHQLIGIALSLLSPQTSQRNRPRAWHRRQTG